MSTPLRLCILGTGLAARLHTRTLRRLDGQVQVSYASRQAERARQMNARHRGAGAYGGYAEALASPTVDAVLVALPPASHLEWTLAALAAGKHVIVEKPAFLRSEDFDAVERAQAGSGRRVLVAENYHYKPLLACLRASLERGDVGDVLFVQLNATKVQRSEGWRDEPSQAGGGALFEGGIHWVNFMASLGLPVRSVKGFLPRPRTDTERSMLAVFEYEGGAVGTLAYSWEAPAALNGVRLSKITGRAGSLSFETNGAFVVLNGRRKRFLVPGLRDIQGYGAMFRDFLGALREGREPRMTLAQARRDLELVEHLYRTAGEPWNSSKRP